MKLGFPGLPLPQAPHPDSSEKSKWLLGQVGEEGVPQTMRRGVLGPVWSVGLAKGESERQAALGTPFTQHITSQNKRQSPQERIRGPAHGPGTPHMVGQTFP